MLVEVMRRLAALRRVACHGSGGAGARDQLVVSKADTVISGDGRRLIILYVLPVHLALDRHALSFENLEVLSSS